MILLVGNYEPHVGYAWKFIAQFWVALARRRQCHLAYPSPGPIPEEIIQAGITPHTLNMREWESVAFIRRHRIHTIYLTDWPAFSPLYALWRLAGVRRIIVHDHAPGDFPPARGVRRLFKRALHELRLFSADQYLGVAEHVSKRHVETWCVPPERCATVTNGIEPFDVSEADREAIRAELGIPHDSFVAIMVGRATRYKNFGFALECLPYLPDNVHFVHCGDGPELPSLQEQTRLKGLEGRMHWLGKRSDVRQLMAASDAAIHPSRGEAMSLALLEAACAGLPIVVPDTPSVSFIVDHMLDGLKYKAGDVPSAVLQLQYLMHPERRRKLGANARQKVLERYTIDRTLAEFDEQVSVYNGPISPSGC
jgi:glycosyltransferase involved in cell wall biosynthesis